MQQENSGVGVTIKEHEIEPILLWRRAEWLFLLIERRNYSDCSHLQRLFNVSDVRKSKTHKL